MEKITLQITLGTHQRNLEIEKTDNFCTLEALIKKEFHLPPSSSLKIRYLDEEEDLITISTDLELSEAISSPSLVLLRLNIVSDQDPSPAPPSPLLEEENQGNQENQENQDAPVDQMTYLLNEFHFHRLILQTAFQSIFESLRSNYEENQKPKIDVFIQGAEAQRKQIWEAIEQAINQWKDELSQLPPAQEISRIAAEKLSHIKTFTSPIIEHIRIGIQTSLEALFAHRNPESLTSSEILKEMDTFASLGVDLSKNDEQGEPQETPEAQKQEEEMPPPSKEETAFPSDQKEISVPSDLSEDFVCIQPFEFMDQLQQLQELGFSNLEACKVALVANSGNVEAALDNLLSPN